jgi:hypothetical protein
MRALLNYKVTTLELEQRKKIVLLALLVFLALC